MTERSRSGKTAWDKEKTRELFRRYKETGDPDAREQLVMSHMNLVRFLANKFKNRGEPLDDLMQVGYLGLLKAIDRFDPERGLEFTTFATPTIWARSNAIFATRAGACAYLVVCRSSRPRSTKLLTNLPTSCSVRPRLRRSLSI